MKAPSKPPKPTLEPLKQVIYGVTDRSKESWSHRANDFLIDHVTRISLKEKGLFYNSLRLLVNSGVHFTRAISMLADRTQNIRLGRILNTVRYDMENRGMSLSGAMAKHPAIFENGEIKMIESGEITGKIEETLNSLGKQIQKNLALQLQVRNALMYPITVFIAIILAAIVVLMFIVPKFTKLFESFEGELPFATRFLMGISDFVIQFWWMLLFIIIGGAFAFHNWKQSDHGKKSWDGFLLRVPLISPLVNNIQTTRIAQNFSALMKSGIPLVKALRILSEIVPNSVVGAAIFNIELHTRKGMPLHESFRNEASLDPVIAEVMEVGEQSGKISEVMAKLGEQYEMEVDAQLKNLTTIIEPIIILIVGIAVVFMAMAIMTPIFELQSLFTNA